MIFFFWINLTHIQRKWEAKAVQKSFVKMANLKLLASFSSNFSSVSLFLFVFAWETFAYDWNSCIFLFSFIWYFNVLSKQKKWFNLSYKYWNELRIYRIGIYFFTLNNDIQLIQTSSKIIIREENIFFVFLN